MSATAPTYRAVCQLTGDVRPDRPSQFFRALSEADNFCAELDRTRELRAENTRLRARVAELEAELAWHTGTPSAATPAAEDRPAPVNPPVGAGQPITQ